MTQVAGIKSSLEQLDSEIVEINQELSQNELTLLNLKNQRARLSSIFEIRIEETERNFKLDVGRFEQQLQRAFNNHNNLTKMSERKVQELKVSQEEIGNSLARIEEAVKEMQEMLG